MVTKEEFEREWNRIRTDIKTLVLKDDYGWIAGSTYKIFEEEERFYVEISYNYVGRSYLSGLTLLSSVEKVSE